MINVRFIRVTLLALVLLLSLNLSGCSVFSTLGGWISSGYDDAIAYFNAYYNAKRLFDEAEAEVLASRSASRGKGLGTSVTPPGSTAKQKFTAVIDKCSNILSFYPKSGMVDDALFLIGKSYFYQDDFLKAERKFKELLVQNPGGSLALDGQLWLLKTLQRLNRFDEANQVGQELTDAALAADKRAIAGEALSILGDVAVAQNITDIAIERYSKSVEASNEGVMKAASQTKIGDVYFGIPDYEKAAGAYLEVEKLSPDDYSLFYSQLQAAICYRHIQRFDDALQILGKIDANYRFLDNRGVIRTELGKTLAQSGKLEESIDMLRFVDTTYARSEAGARAALELGKLFEQRTGNYAAARTAYFHATIGGTQEIVKEATRKTNAFDSYFRLQQQYFRFDSLLYFLDHDTLGGEQTGVASSPKKDSLIVGADTTRARAKPDTVKVLRDMAGSRIQDSSGSVLVKAAPIPKRSVVLDSLGGICFQFGELFYTDLEIPDSAFYWLKQGLKIGLDTLRAPRALYDLADVAHSSPDKRYGDEKDLYRELVDKYPNSRYAEEARIPLGIKPAMKKEDPAMTVYAVAESLMYAGQYSRAIDSLGRIVKVYPESPLVPKSRYMMAWIYENHLSRPDSALSQYKTLVQKYVATKYGIAAARRIPPEPVVADTRVDSTRKLPLDSKKSPADSTKKVMPDSTLKARSTIETKGKLDTIGVTPQIRQAKVDSTKLNVDIDEVERRARAEPDSARSRRAKKEVVKE